MYQALLTRRYLTSKVMPLLAALAVALCVAMVLIVWSVMGGFLTTLLASGRNVMGDVRIAWPVIGFPHYEELIADLKADPMVAGAAAVIETPGLLKLPDESTFLVLVMGVDGKDYDSATGYGDALWWKPLDAPLARDRDAEDERVWDPPPGKGPREPRTESADARQRWRAALQRVYDDGLSLTAHHWLGPARDAAVDDPAGIPAMTLGISVGGLNERKKEGFYIPKYRRVGRFEATLSVIPLSKRGSAVGVQARRFPVVNNVRTGLYEADSRWVFVRLDAVQEMLGMDEAWRVGAKDAAGFSGAPGGGIRVDEKGNEVFVEPSAMERDPARVTSVLVRGAEGVEPPALRARAAEIYGAFAAKHKDVPRAESMRVETWDERPGIAEFVAAVRKEISLVLFLFGFISLTAVFLVLAIFWSMVSEKTKDIGVLRAVGAGRAGVAWLFLRYGMVIGVVGAALGGLLALVVVRNINAIHEFLGDAFGLTIWTPGSYQFSEIPSRLDPLQAALVLAAGVLFSVLGALLPAIKASRLNPVEALRFE